MFRGLCELKQKGEASKRCERLKTSKSDGSEAFCI